MASKLQTQLLQYIASVPSDVNPYLALSTYIKDQFMPTVPGSTITQLYIVATLLGATLLLVIVSILIRIKKRIFWLYQCSYTPYFLVKPHFSLSWSCVAAIMLILFEFLIAQCVDLFKKKLNKSLGYWIFLVWVSAWIGGSFAAHSLGTGLLLQAQTTSSPQALHRWATFSNILAFAAPLAYLALLIPLGVIGGNRFVRVVEVYDEIDAFLHHLASTWTEGTKINVISLAPALPLVNVVVERQDLLFASWRQVFFSYAVTCSILVITLITIALLHLSTLRKTIEDSQRGTATSIDSANRAARLQVRRTWETLVGTVVAFCALGSIFIAVSIFAGLNSQSLQTSLPAQIVVLVPLWAFAILGLPTSVVLVWRAWEATPAENSGSQVKHSTFSRSGSGENSASKKYSIELSGRSRGRTGLTRSRNDANDLDVRFALGVVSVTVDVEVKEEGEFDEDEKKLSASQTL